MSCLYVGPTIFIFKVYRNYRFKIQEFITRKMRWGETITLQFVKIYLKYECLWNPLHSSYKNRSDRESAYLQIISEFKASGGTSLSIPEAKIKIKNLRTTYVQEMRKVLNKSSPGHIYEPSLVWFPEMDKCLKNVIISRRVSDSYQHVSNIFSVS